MDFCLLQYRLECLLEHIPWNFVYNNLRNTDSVLLVFSRRRRAGGAGGRAGAKRSAPWAGPALGNSKSAQISQCLSRRGRLSPAQPCPARRRRRQRWRTPAEATSSKCVSQRPRLFFRTTHPDDDYLYLLLCMSLSRATHPSSESPSAQPVHLCESPGR